jgi:hypothetical protein
MNVRLLSAMSCLLFQNCCSSETRKIQLTVFDVPVHIRDDAYLTSENSLRNVRRNFTEKLHRTDYITSRFPNDLLQLLLLAYL